MSKRRRRPRQIYEMAQTRKMVGGAAGYSLILTKEVTLEGYPVRSWFEVCDQGDALLCRFSSIIAAREFVSSRIEAISASLLMPSSSVAACV
ncbi:MAG: hypothetical protein WBN85_09360 [Candidatus Macondimonas sp.]